MFITDDPTGRVDAHVEFFLLQRAKETRLPVPDVDLVRHHLVGLFESNFTFQVGFRGIVNLKNYARLIPVQMRALCDCELSRLFERGRAGNLEFDGSFREGLEEILIRHARANEARENPDQQNFLVVRAEPLLRQSRLPYYEFPHSSPRAESSDPIGGPGFSPAEAMFHPFGFTGCGKSLTICGSCLQARHKARFSFRGFNP